MKYFMLPVAILAVVLVFTACGSAEPKSLCSTECHEDTIRITGNNADQSFVYISMKNCEADSIAWGHKLLSANKKMLFSDLVGKSVRLQDKFVRAHVNDTSNIWLLFNECENGQGYIVKLPFNNTESIFRKNSAFNTMHPGYQVAEPLVAYTDKGNVFVEDMGTGKKAMMTFGKQLDIDYTNMHDMIDSVNITATKIWVRVKIENEWKEMQKNIVLE